MFEAQQIVEMIKVSITTLFRDSLTVVALMGYLIWFNWKLTLVTIILIPVHDLVGTRCQQALA